MTFQSNEFTVKLDKQTAEFESQSRQADVNIRDLEEHLQAAKKCDLEQQALNKDLQIELKRAEVACEGLKCEMSENIANGAALVAKVEGELKESHEKTNDQNVNISTMQFEIRRLQTQLTETNEKIRDSNEMVDRLNEEIDKLNHRIELDGGNINVRLGNILYSHLSKICSNLSCVFLE